MKYLLPLVTLFFLFGCADRELNTFSFENQLNADIKIIDDYLKSESIEALVHESEIRYIVVSEGSGGNTPSFSSEVTVKYLGSFINGEVFDQTENDDSISFPLNRVIAAWQIMVSEMEVGEKIIIYAPSVYCYGPAGRSGIPPNTNLIFEIELISFQ